MLGNMADNVRFMDVSSAVLMQLYTVPTHMYRYNT